jgi:hypothetical protein
VLIAFGDTAKSLLDVCRTGTPYRPDPTGPWGKVLGATSRGAIVVHHNVAGQACLSQLSLARPFELQCDSLSGLCSEHVPNAPEGLTVAGLVTRLPHDHPGLRGNCNVTA